MIGKTAIVADSASYLPSVVRDRYGIITVPLTVVLDGEGYREFVDLDSATFYRRLSEGATVSTSQPSPGQFLEAFEQAKQLGAERVVAVLIGSGFSGTANSARIAAELAPLPVRVIDTGQASFIEGLCVWEACEVLAAGKSLDEAEAAVQRTAAAAGNVFIVRGLELLERGGRMGAAPLPESPGVPVLAFSDGAVRPIGLCSDVDAALNMMTNYLQAAIAANPGRTFRVGISNGAADELAAMLEARVKEFDFVDEVVQYEVGPAVGAHTGPGCTGIVFVPRPVRFD